MLKKQGWLHQINKDTSSDCTTVQKHLCNKQLVCYFLFFYFSTQILG